MPKFLLKIVRLNIRDLAKQFWATFSTEWFVCRRLNNRGEAAPYFFEFQQAT